MMEQYKETYVPGSRMARGLRAHGSTNGPVSGAGPSGDREGDANREAENEPEDGQEVCEFCGRTFRNKRGLGVHVVRAHAEAANSAIGVERVKARWPEEEIRLMARAEAGAVSEGVRFINQYLHERFPHRTLEAIKGRRRQEAYRRLVQEFCQAPVNTGRAGNGVEETMTRVATPIAMRTGVVNNINGSASSQPTPRNPAMGAERLRNALEELIRAVRRFRSYEAGSLLTIAEDFLEGNINVHAIERWLGTIFPVQTTSPPRRAKTKKRSPLIKRESKKQLRKKEFAIVQNLYRKNLRTCFAHILEGTSKMVRPSSVEFRDYWVPVMEQSSGVNGDMTALRDKYGEAKQVAGTSRSRPSIARGIHLEGIDEGATAASSSPHVDKTSLWDPITTSEVERISVRKGSAPGLDGISPRAWNAVPVPIRALLFNLLLLAGEVPSSIATTRTVFLEKGSMPERPEPSDYRPLSIGSVVLRHLHKILAKRISNLDIIDIRQRGFRPVDGVCENTTVLSAVLSDARRSCRTLHIACVDLSKAFDTVSHDAIHKALEEAELPLAFREYVREIYSTAATVIHGTDGRVPIKLGRGVRQGDPLSPLLFNLVVDRALGILSEDVGYRFGGRVIGALGYADDIVLLSSTKAGLQENLNRLHEAFAMNGLTINAKKTGVLSLVASGRDKKVKVETIPQFTVGGVVIPQRSPKEVWTYLGMTYEGSRELTPVPPLAHSIELLTKAPLKPQQRLRLLRDCLLPRCYHRWVVGSVSAKILKEADVLVRAAVRRWLRFPHDVPAGYFHAPIQSGGLGMPLLRTFIPILKYNRLRTLCTSTMPAALSAAESTYVARQLVWCENQMRIRNNRVTKLSELRRQCAAWLHESHDGRGLREVDSSKLSSYWVSGGAGSIPGADYVHYHHVRANCIPSKARTSRGRPERHVHCRAGCPERETSAHCIQRCFRTHGGRILRHDDLCRKVGGFLRQKGWQVDAELAYSTSAGRRRPDLTIARDGEAVVVDAQVVSSEEELRVAHERKIEKYRSNNDLVNRVAEHTGVTQNNVRFAAITISWRGVWSPTSENELRRLGLTTTQLRTLTTRVLWGSWMNWQRFNKITSRFKEHGERP